VSVGITMNKNAAEIQTFEDIAELLTALSPLAIQSCGGKSAEKFKQHADGLKDRIQAGTQRNRCYLVRDDKGYVNNIYYCPSCNFVVGRSAESRSPGPKNRYGRYKTEYHCVKCDMLVGGEENPPLIL